jgi:hypothetical protein
VHTRRNPVSRSSLLLNFQPCSQPAPRCTLTASSWNIDEVIESCLETAIIATWVGEQKLGWATDKGTSPHRGVTWNVNGLQPKLATESTNSGDGMGVTNPDSIYYMWKGLAYLAQLKIAELFYLVRQYMELYSHTTLWLQAGVNRKWMIQDDGLQKLK